MNPPLTPEMLTLLNATCNRQLDAEQAARLEELLADDEPAIELYLRYLWLETELGLTGAPVDEGEFSAEGVAFDAEEAPSAAPRPAVLMMLHGAARAMLDWQNHPIRFTLLTLALTGWFWVWFFSIIVGWRREPLPSHVAARPAPSEQSIARRTVLVARLTDGFDCVWEQSHEAPTPGAHLAAGARLALRSGVAEVSFRSGARVILQGPAEFHVHTPLTGRLHRGRLFARVPDAAQLFAIETPSCTVVDLGTEFGVEVDHERNVEVQVFTGEVELVPLRSDLNNRPTTRLAAGESRWVSIEGEMRPSALDAARFVREVPARERNLLLHWRFDQVAAGDPPVVSDASGRGHTGLLRGEVQATPVPGRLGDALRFHGGRSRVELAKGGDAVFQRAFNEFTFALWVQPSELGDSRWIVGKMGYKNQRGWQLGHSVDGKLEFVGFDGPRGATQQLATPVPALAPEKFTHIAVTFRGNEFLRIYVDGQLAAELAVPHKLVLGQLNSANTALLQVGNRGDSAQHSFAGVIDDVLLFDRALTAEEIAALATRPEPLAALE